MKLKRLLALVGGVFSLALNSAFAQTDVTSKITNAGFDDCTAETSDVAAKTIIDYSSKGWTKTKSGSYTTIAVTAYGGGKKLATSTTPSTKKDGKTVSGNTLGIIAGWGDEVNIQSDEITLPAGFYTLTVDHYLTSSSNNYVETSSKFGFVTSSNSYLVASTTYTASTWTTETVTFTLTQETKGKIQIGLKGNDKAGSGAPAIFYDDVKLTWTDPDLAAAQVQLGGYITKATAFNGILADAALTTAISTAQGVLDSATTSADCNNASDDLNTALTTALSGGTPVALTNGNFDTTPNNTLSGSVTTFGGTLSTATSNPDNTKDMSANTGDHGYLYDVTGWTQYSTFNSTASQGTTSEYGTAMPANGWSTNSTTPPTADMFGGTSGAALHLSAGWNDQARYMQEIASLPSGRYVFYYEIINQHSNTGIASNYTGVSGTAGDFYGTTNSFVYSDLKSLEQGVWKAQAFEFDVAKTADIKFFVGFTTSSAGSGNGAKLWIDNVLVYRIGDVIVSESDASTILAQVAALDDVAYNATDKSALATAKSTFESSKTLDNYNALNAALIAANASKEVYTALNTAITNVEDWTATTAASGIRTKYNNGTYSNETTAADIYSEYQDAEIAALAADDAEVDWTSVLLNPSFETGDMTCWSAESRNDTGVKDQSNGTYSINSGDAVDGLKLFNSWGGTAENNVNQTIKNLPAGTYTLTALVAGFTGETLTVSANETSNNVVVAGDKTVGYTVSVKFTLDTAGDVVIKASNTKSQDGSDASFIKADNFKLFKGDVMTDDYTDLNTAIDAAEAKTLGFDEGEYAPYENVGALQALAAAKAVNQTVKTAQPVLDEIITNLTGATWTENSGDVDAIHNGLYATVAEGKNYPEGWTRTNAWGQMQSEIEGDYATAYYNQPGSLQYGNQGVYTMPLKASQLYKLTFAYRSHDANNPNKGVTVSVKNGDEGLNAVVFPKNGSTSDWKVVEAYFTTGAAGNYVLTLANDGNTWMTGVSLVKAEESELTLAETTAYTSTLTNYTYFETLTLDRKFSTEKRSTMVLPFALTADETRVAFEEVYELDNVDGQSLKFKATDAIAAGTPYLVKAKAAKLSVTNKALDPSTTVKNTEKSDASSTVTFVGRFSPVVLTAADNGNAYVVSNSTLYQVTSNVNVNAYRGYFTVDTTGGGVKNFVLDFGNGETTSIEALESETRDKVIYNLAGQRVQKAQKGIFIVNGKKVVIK